MFHYLWLLNRVSLWSPDCPGTLYVGQVGLRLRVQPVYSSWVLELKMYATTLSSFLSLMAKKDFVYQILFISGILFLHVHFSLLSSWRALQPRESRAVVRQSDLSQLSRSEGRKPDLITDHWETGQSITMLSHSRCRLRWEPGYRTWSSQSSPRQLISYFGFISRIESWTIYLRVFIYIYVLGGCLWVVFVLRCTLEVRGQPAEVGSKSWTKVLRLDAKHRYLLNHVTSPKAIFVALKKNIFFFCKPEGGGSHL